MIYDAICNLLYNTHIQAGSSPPQFRSELLFKCSQMEVLMGQRIGRQWRQVVSLPSHILVPQLRKNCVYTLITPYIQLCALIMMCEVYDMKVVASTFYIDWNFFKIGDNLNSEVVFYIGCWKCLLNLYLSSPALKRTGISVKCFVWDNRG